MSIIRRSLRLSQFVIPVRVGLYEAERRGPQPVRFDLEVEVDPARPPGDDAHCVLDYDRLREDVAAAAGAQRYGLLETLCEAILLRLADRRMVIAAHIAATKTTLYDDGSEATVALDWRREP